MHVARARHVVERAPYGPGGGLPAMHRAERWNCGHMGLLNDSSGAGRGLAVTTCSTCMGGCCAGSGLMPLSRYGVLAQQLMPLGPAVLNS